MKVGFISLGCSKNLVDSEIMIGLVSSAGYTVTANEAEADVIVINTCGFINDAKEEAISAILEMAKHKHGGSLKKLIVAGCLAQRYRDEILKELPEADTVVGVGRFEDIVEIIESVGGVFIGNENGAYPEYAPRVLSTPPHTAYLKIAEGCDNRCAYCAIPEIRGPFRSRKYEDVIREAKKLAEGGVREINIVAQDTTRYGEDLYGEPKLAELLEDLCKIPELHWIRVLYTYPEKISDRLLEVIKENEKIAKYFDIPIQHINDRILKQMNRRSTSEQIYELIERIKKELPDAVLRTSLIVGFPGETDEDFKELCDFVNWVCFDKLGVFSYSKEEGTPAFSMPCQIDEETKEKRADIIMKLQRSISFQKGQEKLMKVIEVLTEGKHGVDYFGRTMFDAPEIDGRVVFKSEKMLKAGEFVKVLITGAESYDLIGEIAE